MKVHLGVLLFLLPTAGLGLLQERRGEPTPPVRLGAAEVPPTEGGYYTRVPVEMPVQSLETYVQRSDEIVRGIVTGQQPVFPDKGFAYTQVDLWVILGREGIPQGMIRVRVGGAEDETRRVEVVGAPKFVVGEEVLLFVERLRDSATGADYRVIRGLDHGTYRMPMFPEGGPRVVGLHAAGEDVLATFERRVRALMATKERK